MKYYAVKNGRKVGIYASWDECKLQVLGFSDAQYKSFDTREEAEQYISGVIINDDKTEIEAYVDGSFSEQLGKYSFGCVILKNGEIVHTMNGCSLKSEYIEMRNVAGELEAAEQAIKWALRSNVKSIKIYHDYQGIGSWANGEWTANKQGTQEYVSFIEECRKKMRIEFTKVKGHSGHKYNEMADELAKEGLNKNVIEDCTIQFEEYIKRKESGDSRFSFVIKGAITTEKEILSFAKQFLKEKGFKKVTNLKAQYRWDDGCLDITFNAYDVAEKEITIKICD